MKLKQISTKLNEKIGFYDYIDTKNQLIFSCQNFIKIINIFYVASVHFTLIFDHC